MVELACFLTAPAHPQATSVAVYTALLIAETPSYGNFLFGVSQDGLSEDDSVQILLPGRKS